MIEDSLESFITQYKPYAFEAEILARAEGSPLVECIAKQKVIHFLERTAPYLSTPEKHTVILNAVVKNVLLTDDKEKQFDSPALSQLNANGLVLEHHGQHLVVDVGVNVIVSSLEPFDEIALGDWISFGSEVPLHGFVIATPQKKPKDANIEDSL